MKTRYPGNRRGNTLNTIASLFIGVSLIIAGCSPQPPQTTSTPNQTPVVPPPVTPNQTPVVPPPVTPNETPVVPPPVTPNQTQGKSYSKDVQRIFTAFCTKCHDGSEKTRLLLTPAVSYKMLVGVASENNSQILLVKPGAPDESFLLLKLKEEPPHATPPPQSYIDVIWQWILEGALNN